MRILGFLGGTTDPQRGLGFKEASVGAHLEELTFPPPPVCARLEQCMVGSCVLGWPAFLWRRSDHEVGLGLWLCRVLGDFILWSSKHLHVPAGRWWSLKVNLCLYGMFFFKMRKVTCLSPWELELCRGVIRKDISSLRPVGLIGKEEWRLQVSALWCFCLSRPEEAVPLMP